MLHGLRNEDREAHPYDRFAQRLILVTSELTERRLSAVLLQEISLLPLSRYPDVIGTLLDFPWPILKTPAVPASIMSG